MDEHEPLEHWPPRTIGGSGITLKPGEARINTHLVPMVQLVSWEEGKKYSLPSLSVLGAKQLANALLAWANENEQTPK